MCTGPCNHSPGLTIKRLLEDVTSTERERVATQAGYNTAVPAAEEQDEE